MPRRRDVSRSVGDGALRGAIAGCAAIVPMTMVFWAARCLNLLDEVPPHKAVRSLFPNQREPQLSIASAVAHTTVGAVAGALYGTAVPRERGCPTLGGLFGLVIWFVGYEVAMPALTDVAPAHRDQRLRAVTILTAHLVFGTALARVFPKLGKGS